jgi:pantoate--beta-alanine ligase
MIICKESNYLQDILKQQKLFGNQVGFVPTMGALHKGHESLIEKSVAENNITVVSIFVNPRQFNQSEDFENYPRTLDEDLKILQYSGCDVAFLPEYKSVFKDEKNIAVDLNGLDTVLEGEHRPGHFQGVVDVVYRLFEIVEPTKAYFGTKDYQQLLIIKRMLEYFKLPIEIIPCKIIREKDGLALSSRNKRLSKDERENAVNISKAIFFAKDNYRDKTVKEVKKFVWNLMNDNEYLTPEYVEICDPKTLKLCMGNEKVLNKLLLTAVYCGKVRLIDNILLDSK